jgi:CRP/FNR family transcriptional regulator, cyclic AMP receptor protein
VPPESRLLDANQLFASMPESARLQVMDMAVERTFSRGDLLFEQGDASSELFIVRSGRIAIVTHAADGRENVVAVLEEGGLFGELPLFDDAPRMADARALVDSVAVVLPYPALRTVLEAHPEALWVVVRMLARRLRATDEALGDAVFLDVPARTAKRLLELAGDADDFKLPVTQEELASMVGASRERVNKALALFARLGWLEAKGRGKYRILDRQAIEDRANL